MSKFQLLTDSPMKQTKTSEADISLEIIWQLPKLF